MKSGIACLVLGYVLSQFYRAFLAVLAPNLLADVGATPEHLAFAGGVWFIVFAVMQIPVGEALDRIGPRRTAATLLAFGAGGGAMLFAVAQTPNHITLAMALIGIGCSPILMSAYFIFARAYPPAMFATLAGVTLGLGTIGNAASALPLTLAVEVVGWRGAMVGLALMTWIVSVLVFFLVEDPEQVEIRHQGSVLDVLRIRALWPIFAMMFANYAAVAGIRGLWIGPYLTDVYGATAYLVGVGTLVMGIAMVLGNFVYGPLDRIVSSKKMIIFVGNLSCVVALGLLYIFPFSTLWTSIALLALVGFFGSSFAIIVAHGRNFLPAHLTGRVVTLLNLFGIGGQAYYNPQAGGCIHIQWGPACRKYPFKCYSCFLA